jgi:hypothetical protein
MVHRFVEGRSEVLHGLRLPEKLADHPPTDGQSLALQLGNGCGVPLLG